tara:strand:- start:1832 stop:2356 length:525 start_codon:yes stop_codon:yes gene_type:complete
MENKEIFYNAKDFDSAVEVDNYPWGFRLKTKRRYWVETTKRGDRSVYATLNPKTDKWCKPKKSTYESVLVVVKDTETGRVRTEGIGKYAGDDAIASVMEWMDWEKLNDFQKATICKVNAANEVMSKVTFSFRNTSSMTAEEIAGADAEQEKNEKLILNAINAKAYNCLVKNNLV